MKKLCVFFMCFLMIGCQATPSSSQESVVDESQWEGYYVCDDVTLMIGKEDDYDGLVFEVEYEEKDFKDYAYFQDEDHLEAISDLSEDGYTLEFSLKDNKIIVKESGGISYLGIELSGEYVKKE